MLIFDPDERISAQDASGHIYLAARTHLTALPQPSQLAGEGQSAGPPYPDDGPAAGGAVEEGSMDCDESGVSDGVGGKRRGRESSTAVRLRYDRPHQLVRPPSLYLFTSFSCRSKSAPTACSGTVDPNRRIVLDMTSVQAQDGGVVSPEVNPEAEGMDR